MPQARESAPVTRLTPSRYALRAFTNVVNLRTLGGGCTFSAMATGNPNSPPKLDFETAMRDLEQLVERLEKGDLPLEESLAAFERGVMLTRSCQTALKEAEQKVEILLKKAGEPAIEDFDSGESTLG